MCHIRIGIVSCLAESYVMRRTLNELCQQHCFCGVRLTLCRSVQFLPACGFFPLTNRDYLRTTGDGHFCDGAESTDWWEEDSFAFRARKPQRTLKTRNDRPKVFKLLLPALVPVGQFPIANWMVHQAGRVGME